MFDRLLKPLTWWEWRSSTFYPQANKIWTPFYLWLGCYHSWEPSAKEGMEFLECLDRDKGHWEGSCGVS